MPARVLVVDDVPANLKILEAKLSAEYFDVLMAPNGKTALELALNEQPDIILLDVMMPEMDGPATLAALRQLPETAATPVIFLTAFARQTPRAGTPRAWPSTALSSGCARARWAGWWTRR